jgi:dTDP-4-dehydrorhamnose reductase
MRVLVLGASGMLGSAILRVMSEHRELSVHGTLRSKNEALEAMAPHANLICGIDIDKPDSLLSAFSLSVPYYLP